MGDAWAIGPLMIKEKWLVYAAAGLIAYIVIRMGLSKKVIERYVPDFLWNGLLIFGVVWKLSYTLWHPLTVIDRPVSQLYFTGGEKGIVLGLAAAFIYFFYQGKKEHKLLRNFIEPGLVAFLAAFGSFQFIWMALHSFSPIYSLLQMLLSASLIVYWFIRVGSDFKYSLWPGMILWFSLGELLLSFMKDHIPFWLGFSFGQWVWMTISLVIILVPYVMKGIFNKT